MRGALYAGMLLTLAQGLDLLTAASKAYAYQLNLATIARIWRGGCIIQARVLDAVAKAYQGEPGLPQLLLAPELARLVAERDGALRRASQIATEHALSAPAIQSALAYWDALRDTELPMNIVQAQRDFFGAHGLERRDKPGTFHFPWRR